MLRRAALIATSFLTITACQAAVTNVQTRPAGTSGSVQFNNSGVFGSSPTFTYDKTNSDLSVSSVSVTFIDGSTASLKQIRWGDGTTQTTAAGSGSYINDGSSPESKTFNVASGTVNTFNVGEYIKFPDGTQQTTAGGGGGGGSFWVGTATSALNMQNTYSIYGATMVITSSMAVTGATITINGVTYNYPSAVGTGSRLVQLDYSGGRATVSFPTAIIDGMRTSSTDTVSGAKVFQSSITLPTSTRVQTVDAVGEIMIDTAAYTTQGSSSTLVYYADGRKYYVVATTGPPPDNYIPKYDRTLNQWSVEVDSGSTGGGGSGSPGGNNTEFQFNNAGSFDGVGVATYNATSGQITFSSGVSHVNIASVTYTNTNQVLQLNSKVYWPDGTVQVSSPPASILDQSTAQSATFHVTSGTVQNNFNFTDSDSAQVLTFHHSSLPRSGGFGPQTVDTTIHARSFTNSGVEGVFSLQTSSGAFTDSTPIPTKLTLTGGSTPSATFFAGASSAEFSVGNGYAGPLKGNAIRFYEDDSVNYVAFKSADSVGSNVTWTLPDSDGSSGQVLSTDGSGTLSWETASGGGGSSDNLGNHVATKTLDMAGFSISGIPALVTTGTITAGSGANQITTAAGLLDTTKLATAVSLSTGVTGTLADGSLSANVSLLGSQIDIGTETNLAATSPVLLTDDTLSLEPISLSTGVTGSLPAASIADGSLGASVMASSITAGTVQTALSAGSNITLTNTAAGVQIDAAGGSGPFTNAIATTSVAMATFSITGVSSVTYSNNGVPWTVYGSSVGVTVSDFVVNSGTINVVGLSFQVAANSTYTFSGSILFTTPGSTTGGLKIGVDAPNLLSSVRVHAMGAGSSATAGRFSEGTTSDGGVIGTAFGGAASLSFPQIIFNGLLKTGPTAGTFSITVSPGGSGITIRNGSRATLTRYEP